MRTIADCEATVNAEADDEREKEAMRRDLDALQQQLVTVIQELADTKSVAIAASEVSLNELARCVGEALYEGHLKPYLEGLKEASKCQDPSFEVPAFDYHRFVFGLVQQNMIASIDPDTLPSPVDEADGDAAYALWVELEDWDFWDLFEAVASADLRTRATMAEAQRAAVKDQIRAMEAVHDALRHRRLEDPAAPSAEYHYRAQPIPFTHPDSPALPEHIANELFTDVSGTNGETCHQCTAIGSFFALLNDLVRISEERGSSAVSPAEVIVCVALRAFVERHPLHDPTWRGRLRKEWLEGYAQKFARAAAFAVPRGFDRNPAARSSRF
ncbi:hypothetical protein Rhopal_002485-T1 [Rhodotorula paludigena]|uniref:Uncharacterized protein n=1 Tax=Rhodotorula paludigena TaxID=86838 RepID=A0AAV5GLF2_9BASI|nr:hypothetical protein Rhopal_002485-T1 [Rhodotorula paludigena]